MRFSVTSRPKLISCINFGIALIAAICCFVGLRPFDSEEFSTKNLGSMRAYFIILDILCPLFALMAPIIAAFSKFEASKVMTYASIVFNWSFLWIVASTIPFCEYFQFTCDSSTLAVGLAMMTFNSLIFLIWLVFVTSTPREENSLERFQRLSNDF